ncbi:hypothetical protein GTO27_08325 [Candidatus Bathyarchaeota archaeon]|nr:hypothetical protein [Candidatus Bathyarchaeota archaeon]
MRFPKKEIKEGAEDFLRACESSPTPLLVIPLAYKGYKLLRTYASLRK